MAELQLYLRLASPAVHTLPLPHGGAHPLRIGRAGCAALLARRGAAAHRSHARLESASSGSSNEKADI